MDMSVGWMWCGGGEQYMGGEGANMFKIETGEGV